MYKGRRVFRVGPGWIVFIAALTAFFAIGAYVTYRERGWTWVSVGLALATVFLGLGSIIEKLVLRIELTEDGKAYRPLSSCATDAGSSCRRWRKTCPTRSARG